MFNQNVFLKNRVVIFNKIISSELEQILFKISNYTWIGYNKSFLGSSGVLFLSSAMQIPVIGNNVGLISYYIKKYKIGYSLDVNNIAKLVKFLNHLDKKKIFNPKNFNKVNRTFTIKKFQEIIFEKLMQLNIS